MLSVASILKVGSAFAAGVIGWVTLNLFGNPVLVLRAKRGEALGASGLYACIGFNTEPSDEGVKQALAALSDIDSAVRGYATENAFPPDVGFPLIAAAMRK